MSMFDYVNVELECPSCNDNIITEFQTKTGSCVLEKIDPEMTNEFHSLCDNCGAWIEYARTYETIEHREQPYTSEEIEQMGFVLMVDFDQQRDN